MMTMNRYGSAYSTSTKRIIQPSMRPPANPATIPKPMPIARLSALATRLSASDRRTPVQGAHVQVAPEPVGAEPVRRR